MKTYICLKEIKAKAMNLGDYNKYKGWTMPKDEDPSTEGYFVKDPNDYTSWTPKDPFNKSHKELDMSKLLELGSMEHTFVQYDITYTFHNFHHYVVKTDDKVVADIQFQEGPVKEYGINGCHHEDLINIVIHRLNNFQNGSFKCRENALALTKLEEALHWLKARTDGRKKRGVEGTNKV